MYFYSVPIPHKFFYKIWCFSSMYTYSVSALVICFSEFVGISHSNIICMYNMSVCLHNIACTSKPEDDNDGIFELFPSVL